jgi:hypothetical protein
LVEFFQQGYENIRNIDDHYIPNYIERIRENPDTRSKFESEMVIMGEKIIWLLESGFHIRNIISDNPLFKQLLRSYYPDINAYMEMFM